MKQLFGRSRIPALEIVVDRDSVCPEDAAANHRRQVSLPGDATYQDLFRILKKQAYFPKAAGNNAVWVLTAKGHDCIFSYYTKTDRFFAELLEKELRKLCEKSQEMVLKYYESPEAWKKEIQSWYPGDTYGLWRDGWLTELEYCDRVMSLGPGKRGMEKAAFEISYSRLSIAGWIVLPLSLTVITVLYGLSAGFTQEIRCTLWIALIYCLMTAAALIPRMLFRIKVSRSTLEGRTRSGKRFSFPCSKISRVFCSKEMLHHKAISAPVYYLTIKTKDRTLKLEHSMKGFSEMAEYLLNQCQAGQIDRRAVSNTCKEALTSYKKRDYQMKKRVKATELSYTSIPYGQITHVYCTAKAGSRPGHRPSITIHTRDFQLALKSGATDCREAAAYLLAGYESGEIATSAIAPFSRKKLHDMLNSKPASY
ncbi:MAG: hypothetical protein Q4F17_08950 [Eubacteriales bacterium]|nr:hypothetical protein [Eubacteriales bacterium]